MKINPLNDAALAATAAAAAVAKTERGAAPVVAPAVQDASAGVPVTMSSAARSLDATAAAGSGIDEAKVAAMKAAIANGTFTVNAGAIADKLLSNAQEFLSRART